jgi:HAMP domain-containing protein
VDNDPAGATAESPSADTAVILQMYQTAVEMADRTSARRAGANSFFLTLNTVLAAVVGIVSSARKPPPHGNVPTFDAFGLVLTAAAGIVLAITWRNLLRYYRRLNSAKFDVINELEKRLPVQPYADEWKILHPEEALGSETPKPSFRHFVQRWQRWRRDTKFREATVVEQVVPIVFVVIYLVLALRVVFQ